MILEVTDEHRETQTYECEDFTVAGGGLVIAGADGKAVAVYAPGSWRRACPKPSSGLAAVKALVTP